MDADFSYSVPHSSNYSHANEFKTTQQCVFEGSPALYERVGSFFSKGRDNRDSRAACFWEIMKPQLLIHFTHALQLALLFKGCILLSPLL